MLGQETCFELSVEITSSVLSGCNGIKLETNFNVKDGVFTVMMKLITTLLKKEQVKEKKEVTKNI